MEQNHLYNFAKWHYNDHLCKIIMSIGQWLRRFFNFQIWQPFCSMNQNNLCNFGRGYGVEHVLLNCIAFWPEVH